MTWKEFWWNLFPNGLLSSPPRQPAIKNVSSGESTCHHQFVHVDWDEKRLGPQVTNFGQYYATYHELYRCSRCGAEKIASVGDLI